MKPTITLAHAQRFHTLLAQRGTGPESALSAKDCAHRLEFTGNKEDSERRVRACRELALRNGLLICSGPRGYYLPASMEDVQASCARRQSQVKDMSVLINLEFQLAEKYFRAPRPAKKSKPAYNASQILLAI